jgi:tape measure domain-containing protein
MSKTVDSRIVEMQFDNSNFEKNVKTSMSTLDKLKHAFKMDDASKSMRQLNREIEKVNPGILGQAVQQVTVKFSALQIAGYTALKRISDQAITTGKNLIKSLSVDNIAAGWDKYAEKTTAVATLISQGYNMDEVTKQLERLNWFTDETSYNFTDMVKNIGMFTASGQSLEDSVEAMMGIANWAALSGQNAQTASRAMYQISQAMGSGQLRKQDYMSIQNANMDTLEFRKNLIEAGVELGTLEKIGDDAYKSLTASSKEFSTSQLPNHLTDDAWATSEVMMKAFKRYSEAVNQIYEYTEEHGITASQAIEELGNSVDAFGLKAFRSAQEAKTFNDVIDSVKDAVATGWMNSFEKILGNYEQQKVLWTDMANYLYDIFAGPAEARNEFLEESFAVTNWERLRRVITDTGGDVNQFEKTLEQVGKANGVLTDQMIKDAGSLAKSLTSGWADEKIIKQAVLAYDDYMKKAFKNKRRNPIWDDFVKKVESGDTEILSIISEITGSGRKFLVEGFYNTFDSILGILNAVKKGFKNVFPPITAKQLKNALESVRNLTKSMTDFINLDVNQEKFSNIFTGAFSILGIVKDFATGIFKFIKDDLIGDAFDGIPQSIFDFLSNVGQGITNLRAQLRGGEAIREFLVSVKTEIQNGIVVLNSYWEKFKNLKGVKPIFDGISSALSKLSFKKIDFSSFTNFFKSVKAVGKEVIDSFGAINISFEGFGEIFYKIGEKVSAVKDWIVNSWNGIGKSINTSVESASSGFEKLKTLAGNAIAWIGEKIKEINWTSIAVFAGLIVIISIFRGIGKLVDKFLTILDGPAKVITSLAKTIADLPKLVADTLIQISKDSPGDTFKSIATGILMLSASLAILANIPADRLWESVLVLGAIGAAVSVFTILISVFSKAADFKNVGYSMAAMGAAILMTVVALKKIQDMDFASMGPEILMFAALMVALTTAATIMARASKGTGIGGFMSAIGIALSLKMIVDTLKDLQGFDVKGNIKAIVMIGGLIAAMALAMRASKGVKLGAVATLLGIAYVMQKLVDVFKKIDSSALEGSKEKVRLFQGLAIALGIVMLSLSIGGSKNAAKGGLAIVSLAASLYIAYVAIKKFANIPKEVFKKGAANAGLVALAFSVFMALSKFSGQYAGRAGLAIMSLALSLYILIPAIYILGGMDTDRLVKGAATVAAFIIAFGIMLRGVAGVNKGGAAKIVLIGTMITMMFAAVSLISLLDWKSALIGLGGLAAISLVLAILLRTISSMEKISGSVMLTIALLTGVIWGFGAMIKMFGEIDDVKGAISLAGSVGILILALSQVLAIVSKAKFSRSWKMMGKLYTTMAAFTAIAFAMGVLVSIFNDIQNPIGAIILAESVSLLLYVISQCAVVLSKSTFANKSLDKIIDSVMILTTVAFIMGGMIAAFGNIENPGGAITLALSVSILLGAISACVILLSKTTFGNKNIKKISITVGLLAVIAAGLTAVVGKFSGMTDPKSVLPLVVGVSILLGAITGACLLLQFAGKIAPEAILSVSILGALAIGLGTMLGLLLSSTGQVEGAITAAVAISTMVLALSAACILLGVAGTFGIAGLAGVGIFTVLVIALVGLTLLIRWVSGLMSMTEEDLANMKAFMDGLKIVLVGIADAIGSAMIQTVVSFTAGFKNVAQNIKDAMDIAAQIQPIGADNIVAVLQAIVGIAGLKVAAGEGWAGMVVEFFTGRGTDKVTEVLADITKTGGLLEQMASFGEACSKMDPNMKSNITNFAAAIRGLSDGLKDPPNKNNMINLQNMLKDLSSEDFMSSLKAFADSVGIISAGNLEKVANLSTAIAGIVSAAKESKNVKNLDDLKDLCSKLPDIAKDMGSLGSNFTNIASGLTAAQGIVDIIKLITEGIAGNGDDKKGLFGLDLSQFTSNITASGGWLQDIMGETDLAKFTDNLSDAVRNIQYMVQTADELGFLKDKGTKAKTVAAAIGDVISSITSGSGQIGRTGGSITDFIGETQTLGDYTDDLDDVIRNLGAMCDAYDDALTGRDPVSVAKIIGDVIAGIASSAKSLPKTGGTWQKIFGENGLTGLGQIGRQFGIFAVAISEIDGSQVSKASTIANALANIGIAFAGFKEGMDIDITPIEGKLTSLGKTIQSFSDSLTGFDYTNITQFSSKIKELGESLLTLGGEEATSGAESAVDLTSAGTDIKEKLNNLISGAITDTFSENGSVFSSMSSGVGDFLSKTGTAISEGGQSIFDAAKGIGTNICDGLVKGINDKIETVKNTAKAVGEAAVSACAQGAQVNSPSKATIETARYIIAGLVNTLRNKSGEVYDESWNMGRKATQGLDDALSTVRDTIEGKVSDHPVIRPVLDLSDVQNGVTTLDSMFSRNRALAVDAIRTKRQTAVETENQNGSTKSGPSYNFVQNNYSPKALSRIEIYRQTKNQFSALKGATMV